MIVANILDAPDILAMAGDGSSSGRVIELVKRLHNGGHATLLSRKRDACVIGDPLGNGKWSMHILSQPEARGKDLWLFGLKALRWMVSDRRLETALFFVSQDNKPLLRFLSYYGLSKVADVSSTETLYIASREQIKQACIKHQIEWRK